MLTTTLVPSGCLIVVLVALDGGGSVAVVYRFDLQQSRDGNHAIVVFGANFAHWTAPVQSIKVAPRSVRTNNGKSIPNVGEATELTLTPPL